MFMFLLGIVIAMMMTLLVYGAWMLLIAFTLWMAIDAGKQDRFWWVVLIIGIPFVGSAVYFFTEKKHEYAKAKPHHIHESETEEQHESTPHHKAHHTAKESAVVTDLTKEESSTKKEDIQS